MHGSPETQQNNCSLLSYVLSLLGIWIQMIESVEMKKDESYIKHIFEVFSVFLVKSISWIWTEILKGK